MRPLEHRRWFVLVSFALAAAVTTGLWVLAGLPWRPQAATVFVFATVGIAVGIDRPLALILIRMRPTLGAL